MSLADTAARLGFPTLTAKDFSELNQRYGIIAEPHAGAGHRYSHRAYFQIVRETPRMTAREYIFRFGFAALVEHRHAAEGNSPEEAVERLCAANGIPTR